MAGRNQRQAKYTLGDIVRHRVFPFRGVVYDIDAEFANTEEWYQAIPAAVRPRRDQPFYHLFAVGPNGPYEAYVSEQNLVPDEENGPVAHPMAAQRFAAFDGRRYRIQDGVLN